MARYLVRARATRISTDRNPLLYRVHRRHATPPSASPPPCTSTLVPSSGQLNLFHGLSPHSAHFIRRRRPPTAPLQLNAGTPERHSDQLWAAQPEPIALRSPSHRLHVPRRRASVRDRPSVNARRHPFPCASPPRPAKLAGTHRACIPFLSCSLGRPFVALHSSRSRSAQHSPACVLASATGAFRRAPEG